MIYIDSSIVLAHLLSEDRRPKPGLWSERLISSRLTVYETWVRLNRRRVDASREEAARDLLSRCFFVELTRDVLGRALDPFPVPLRTLDALHIATATYLLSSPRDLALATFDRRMAEAARAMDIPLWEDL